MEPVEHFTEERVFSRMRRLRLSAAAVGRMLKVTRSTAALWLDPSLMEKRQAWLRRAWMAMEEFEAMFGAPAPREKGKRKTRRGPRAKKVQHGDAPAWESPSAPAFGEGAQS